MFQKDAKSMIIRELKLFVPLFVIFYSGVMIWKYLVHDELTWLSTFLLMFIIPLIIIVLGKTKKKDTNS